MRRAEHDDHQSQIPIGDIEPGAGNDDEQHRGYLPHGNARARSGQKQELQLPVEVRDVLSVVPLENGVASDARIKHPGYAERGEQHAAVGEERARGESTGSAPRLTSP